MAAAAERATREKIIRQLEADVKKSEEQTLAHTPSLGALAMSGVMTFLGAALVAWFFSSNNIPTTSVSSSLFVGNSLQFNSTILDISYYELPRPTSPLFGSQYDLQKPTIFRGSIAASWRSHHPWSSITSFLTTPLITNSRDLTQLKHCYKLQAASKCQSSTPAVSALFESITPVSLKTFGSMMTAKQPDQCVTVDLPLDEEFGLDLPSWNNLIVPASVDQRISVRLSSPQVTYSPSSHYGHAMIAQLHGETKIVAFSDFEFEQPLLHPAVNLFSSTPISEQLDALGLEQLPLVKPLALRQGVIRPGEILYIPPGWSWTSQSVSANLLLIFESSTIQQQVAASSTSTTRTSCET